MLNVANAPAEKCLRQFIARSTGIDWPKPPYESFRQEIRFLTGGHGTIWDLACESIARMRAVKQLERRLLAGTSLAELTLDWDRQAEQLAWLNATLAELQGRRNEP